MFPTSAVCFAVQGKVTLDHFIEHCRGRTIGYENAVRRCKVGQTPGAGGPESNWCVMAGSALFPTTQTLSPTISPLIYYLDCTLTCPRFSSHLRRLRRRFCYRQLNLLSMDSPNNTSPDMLVLVVFARRDPDSIVPVYAPPSCPCRPGGKGTVRRKVVKSTKASGGQDDRKLQAALKKLNMQPISSVEELNMFREDGSVLHFSAPKGMCYCPCPILPMLRVPMDCGSLWARADVLIRGGGRAVLMTLSSGDPTQRSHTTQSMGL